MNSLNKKQYALIKCMERVKIFSGLSPTDILFILKVARTKSYGVGEFVYRVGEKGDEMLVLLNGSLAVVVATGQKVAEIKAGTCVGEMALFTGEPRSASIVAEVPSTGLTLTRSSIRLALKSMPNAYSGILENVIVVLSERLAEANSRV
ncbi:MAG: CRP-like cAMP-binding protein [Candidatus Latescibacterota bacterium]|jgi:CRP-like cAMP-binding protein